MTLSDFWELINELESEGQDVDLLKVAVNNAELSGLKDIDDSLAAIHANAEAFFAEHGRPMFTSAAGDVLLIVAANAIPRPKSGHGREDHSLRPNVVGPVPGTWA